MELKKLRKFLLSPFFNQRKDLLQLYDIIIAELKNNDSLINKEKIYTLLCPNEKFNSTKMRLLMSYLFGLVQQYLSWEEFSSNKWEQSLHTLRSYRKHGLMIDFEQKISQFETSIQKQNLRNSNYYYLLYQIALEKYLISVENEPEQEKHLLILTKNFDIFRIASRLKHQCALLSFQLVYKLNYQLDSIESIILTIQQSDYLNIPPINLYYYCYLMLKYAEEESHFFHFKEQLFKFDNYFEMSEKKDLFRIGINYCVKQINNGSSDYVTEIFELYKGGLNNKYLFENGGLPRFTYYNIVAAALNVKQYDWTVNFIKNYKNQLKKIYRESAYSLNMARLEYSRKNYQDVLQLLQQFNYRDVLPNLLAKTLLLKIYWELEEYDILESHLEAMQRYIRRKAVIGYHKTNYLNIVKMTKKLLRVNPNSQNSKQNLKELINATKILTERKWFLEQLDIL